MERKNDISLNELKNKLGEEKTKEMEKVLGTLKDKMNPSENDMETLKGLADKYVGKSEDDLFSEIIKLNEKLNGGEKSDEFKNRIKKLETLRPLLNEEQQKKLDKILKALQ